MRDDASNDQISASQLEPLEVGDRTIWAARPMAEWRERGYVPDSDEEEDVGWGTGLSAAISPTASVAPATSKGLESIVGIGELTKGVEIEHIGSTFAVGSGNDVLSRKVESTLAEKRFGKDKELLQSDSLGNAATEVTECEDAKPSKTQSGPSKTTGAHEITSVSVGDRLEAEVEYGLKSVREILGNTCVQLRLNSANHSCSSSPLSSIRSFTDDEEVVESAGHNKLMHGQTNRSTEAEPTDWHYQHDSHPRYLGRELRQRNPIQIHPYALEDARYQQELKARGLKPVKVAPVSSEIYRNPAADDTQHQDLFSNNQVDDSQSIGDVDSALRSQNISPPGSSRAARSTRPLELFEDDGELPELSAILGGEVPNWLPNKRRKVAHKSSRETSQPFGRREFHIPELPPADLGHARHEEMGIDIFEIPHSPPHSGSSNVSSALMTPNDMSGPAQRLTPLGLPTPVASSLTKALSEPMIETDNSEISEGSQTDGSSVRGSSPPAAERRQWRAVQSVQRRIKGVLPASWLTLDLDKQTIKKKSRRPSVGSPIQKSVAKGVAQKLKTNKPRRSLIEDGGVPVIDISEDSASDTSHSSSAKAWARQPPQLFEDGDIDGFGEPSLDDVIEDNHIDTLPPPLLRTGRKRRPPVKGQRTLDESLSTTGIFSLDRPRSLKARHEGTKQPRARRKHSHSKPVPVALQLEILDAPSFAQLSADDQPQFLKIAARRARTRRDKSRPGHSSKYVRSSLEANTRDVHSRLLVPGESRVRPQAKDLSFLPEHSLTQGPLPDHQPYQRTSDVPDLSTRPIRAAIPNPEQIASLKTSTAATIHRILLRQVGNSAFTSLDDYSTKRKASNAHPVLPQRSLPSRLLSHYQNRSGKGRMISSFAQGRVLRPAQLEAFQSSPQHISDKSLPSQGPPQSRKRVPQQQKIIKTHELPSGHAAVSSPTMARTLRPLGQPLPQHLPGPPVAEDGQIVTALKRGQMPFLMEGTFYHESTLIGSGDLAETILKILKTPRSLHLNNGDSRSFSLPNTKVLYIWDAWNPTVASQFISVCQTLFQECSFAITTQDNTLHAILARLTQYLRRIIDYINHVLYFEDAAARTSFVTTCVEILPSIVMVASSTERVPDEVQGPILHILNHVVVLAFQVSHIASVAPVEYGLQLQAWDLFDTIARRILSLTLSERGQSKLLEYLRVNKIRSERERGIRMDYPEVDAMVIVSHLSNRKILGESCSTMIYKILATKLEGHGDNHTYDSVLEVMAFIWTIAPFFSIKDTGCLSRKRFTKDDFARWPAVLSVFEAFLKSRTYSKDPNAPDNIIGRRYIHLCVHLATGWGWIDCAGLVQLLRTQYGSNNMDELFAEKSSNTRDFLDNYPGYGRIPSPFDNDSGFDSFLKLIITSGMQKASRSEKISNLSNFIFSLVPNSGQLVRKNQNHDHRVLRPLQNRHDLYSALYFISPLETKIRLLPQIQSLVDLRESHIRACTISLDTLIRLLRFQISTDEDPRILYHLSKSIQDMIKKMEGQFDAARLEAFAQVEGTVPGENVLNTVRFNQRNIQKFLKSTIQAWSDCIRDCRTPDQAGYLLFGEDCGAVLSLCNRAMALNPESKLLPTTPTRKGCSSSWADRRLP
jgi:Mus7/MMS22 family